MSPGPSPAPVPAPSSPAVPPAWVRSGAARFHCSEKKFLTGLLLLATLLTIVAGWLYSYFCPSTDDAYVFANIVGVAPQVDGPVIAVHVRDNQAVKKGDPLFEIDPQPFQVAVARCQADLEKAKAAADKASKHYDRIKLMAGQNFISQDQLDQALAERDQTASAVDAAQASLNEANLRLGYTRLTSTVNGVVTNVRLSPGTYLKAGQSVFALIDSDSWHVSAYFRETTVRRIVPGMTARVRLIMYPGYSYTGKVEGVGWGVFQQDGSDTPALLPDINPTVDWIRLAARFPVRINLGNFKSDHPLRMGARATVEILPGEGEKP